MDARGLSHIRIVEDPDGDPMTWAELREEFGRHDVYMDEYVTFEPVDPDWRQFQVVDLRNDEVSDELARDAEYQETPSVSYEPGKWSIHRAYEYGLYLDSAHSDEDEFLAALIDRLVKHYEHQTYVLRIMKNSDRIH